jgi:hypothetical protein
VVLGLMLARSLRQTPDSPIFDASYGASLSEHETAGCTGNSMFCQWSWVMAYRLEAHSLTSRRLPGRTYAEVRLLSCSLIEG